MRYFSLFLLFSLLSVNLKGQFPFWRANNWSDVVVLQLLYNLAENKLWLICAIQHGVLWNNWLELVQLKQNHIFSCFWFLIAVKSSTHIYSTIDALTATYTLTSSCVLLLLLFLLSSFSLLILFDYIMALSKFGSDWFSWSNGTLHPSVSNNVSKRWTFVCWGLKHISNKIFKFLCEETRRFSILMLTPEKICLVCSNQFVVLICFDVGLQKWRMTRIQDE